jgi:hypothetical protein
VKFLIYLLKRERTRVHTVNQAFHGKWNRNVKKICIFQFSSQIELTIIEDEPKASQ